MKVCFELDGSETTVDVPPEKPLREVLRADCGQRSVKTGCDSGRCGACTVLLDGDAVKSCLVVAGKVDGRSVTTVSGIEDGSLGRAVQEAFQAHDALQCGYCTPGFVLSALSYLDDDEPTSVEDAFVGNVCRCTGYQRILAAVEDVAEGRGDD